MTIQDRIGWYAAAALLAASSAVMAAPELSGRELCQRLTAEEVSTIVGAGRTAKEGDGRCTYSASSRPDIRLMNSSSDTRAEFLELKQKPYSDWLLEGWQTIRPQDLAKPTVIDESFLGTLEYRLDPM